MVEIRVHGRGGQGGVTLAKIIATSRFLLGKSVQAFGLYAAERSGAPIRAFCRYDDQPIANRNLIYNPDHVIVLDPTLIGPGVTEGLKAGGWVVLNTPQPPEDYAELFARFRLAAVDATTIARENKLGTRSVPIVNTALAGAVGRVLGFGLQEMLAALEHLGFTGSNPTAASQAYEQVRSIDTPRQLVKEIAPESPSAAAPLEKPQLPPSFVEGAGGAPPAIRTGQWASKQPRRQQMIPPCNHVCPAGNNVHGFLQALGRGQTDEALRILLLTSPFPSVCGRVCPAPCMAACNREQLDTPVNVLQLERLAGDEGQVTIEPSAKRDASVGVIGSGPAGLSAAYHLARLGYGVIVYESGSELGGLLRAGIPEFRLPADVVDREIDRVLDLGVVARTHYRVDRRELLQLARSHEAVLVATGLQELRSMQLGVANSDTVWQGIDFLDRTHHHQVRVDGEDVLVIGGGNTAMDAARSALRLGASRVRVVYRRTRKEMPAIREEIDEAFEEGIEMHFLARPIKMREQAADGNGRLGCVVTFRRLELGTPDESGRCRPVDVADSDFEVVCDRVILALGQSPDLSVFPEGTEVREGHQLLGLLETPVFAVGDLATGDGTVAGAIGSGRRSALHIHEALSGEHVSVSEHAMARRDVDVWVDDVIRPEAMKLHLFERFPSRQGDTIASKERRTTFHEVHLGLPDANEAKRCLSCGVCNECDLCRTYCPEGVLKRVGHEFVFDYSFCKGCGVCVTECPRNVIFMSHV